MTSQLRTPQRTPTMNVTTAERISELTDDDVRKLTYIFHIKPEQAFDEAWLSSQAKSISKLPSKLLKPTNPFSRLGLKLHIGAQQASLCKTHKALNPRLIRRIFLQLVKEVTVRNASLSKWPCPPNVEAWLKRIHKINSLWISPDMYRATYQAQLHEERFNMVEDGCEACILSRIGGDFQVLLDLEVSAWSRRKKGAPHDPRLLRFTDAWFDWFQTSEDVSELNRGFAREVREIRRFCLEERRRNRAERENKRGNVAPRARAAAFSSSSRPSSLQRDYSAAKFTPPEGLMKAVPVMQDPFAHVVFPVHGEDDDDEEQEDEASVIDYYANRMSKAMGPNQTAPPAKGMHTAFRRKAMASDETLNPYTYKAVKRTNATAGNKGSSQAAERGQLGRSSSVQGTFPTPRPRKRSVASAYTASVYSQATSEGGAYAGGAYDTQSPYVPPLRIPPKTPAQKPTRTERGPPPAAPKANQFFAQTEDHAEAAWQHHLQQGAIESNWTDETVHAAGSVRTGSQRETDESRANRTSEDHARAYRDQVADDRARSYQALVGQQDPSPSPRNHPPAPSQRNRRGFRAPSPDRASARSGGTDWENFYK